MAVNHLQLPTHVHQSKHSIPLLRQQLERLSRLREVIKKQHELLAQQLLHQIRNSLNQPYPDEKIRSITVIQQSLLANIHKQNFLNQVISQVVLKIERRLSQQSETLYENTSPTI